MTPQSVLRLLISFLVIFTLSCTHTKKDFNGLIENGRCDEALTKVPENDPLVKLSLNGKQAMGTVASYTMVGATYTVEVLWDILGGTVMFVGLCGPMIAAATLSAGSGSSEPLFCIPGKFNALSAPPLGRRALKSTAAMRCPDLRSLSASLRKVSSCYESKKDKESISKAMKNLVALKTSTEFYRCLPTEEQQAVNDQLDRLSALE